MPQIRKGDTVKVIAGKEKGKSGKVLEVLREEGRPSVRMPFSKRFSSTAIDVPRITLLPVTGLVHSGRC